MKAIPHETTKQKQTKKPHKKPDRIYETIVAKPFQAMKNRPCEVGK